MRNEIDHFAHQQLKLSSTKVEEVFQGQISVKQKDGKRLCAFFLEVDFRPWPTLFPLIKELDNLVPHRADNHVYLDGYFCLSTQSYQQYLIRSKQISTLPDFWTIVVEPYLIRQELLLRGNQDAFKGREFSHGVKGQLQAYASILNISINQVPLVLYSYLNANRFPVDGKNRNKPCICGSGRKQKECTHQDSLLRLIDFEILRKEYEAILQYLQLMTPLFAPTLSLP